MTGDLLLSPRLIVAAMLIIWSIVSCPTTAEECSLGNYYKCHQPMKDLFENKGWLEQDVNDIRGTEKDKDELCKVMQDYMSCVEGFIHNCPDVLKDQHNREKDIMNDAGCPHGSRGYLVAIWMGVAVLLIALAGIGCFIIYEKTCKRRHYQQ